MLLQSHLPLLLAALATAEQHVLAPATQHIPDIAIVQAALDAHSDPVDAYLAIHPEAVDELSEPRLLRVAGEEKWMTEGDKMRLRREGLKFMDVTEYEEYYAQQVDAAVAGKARR